jgi:hypothetical protein
MRKYREIGVLQIFTTLLLLSSAGAFSGEKPAIKHFGGGKPVNVDDLPDCTLTQQLKKLSNEKQKAALARLAKMNFSTHTIQDLRADDNGGIYCSCGVNAAKLLEYTKAAAAAEANAPAVADGAPIIAESPVPVTTPPVYHSKSGSTNVIILDFNGMVVTGTQWKSGATLDAYAFSLDSDYTTFSDSEQTFIKRVWERVSEVFSAYDVDVTTEEPATLTSTTGRLLITKSVDKNGVNMPSSGAGGVAFVDVFGTDEYLSLYSPAFVYYDNLLSKEEIVAMAAAHEIGHNFGLLHDYSNNDFSTSGYYLGHGSGDTEWCPIMGAAYYVNVPQWSKGEYNNAQQHEDDLFILYEHLGYRTDDHGGTLSTATALTLTGGTTISSTTPETDPTNSSPQNKGILEKTNDVDVFSFEAGVGAVSIIINPWKSPANTHGGSVDLQAELYDGGGNLLGTFEDPSHLYTTVSYNITTAGGYYLLIKNTGTGDPYAAYPGTTGYTNYGCVGQYFISGTVPDASGIGFPKATIAATDAAAHEENGDTGTFTVTLSRAVNYAVTIPYTISGIAVNGTDYSTIATSITIPANNLSGTVTITALNDALAEIQEDVTLTLGSGQGYVLGNTTSATVYITDDDGLPTAEIFLDGNKAVESSSNPFTGDFRVQLSAKVGIPVTVNFTVSGTATQGTDYQSIGTSVTIPAGANHAYFTITPIDDGLTEGDETVIINLATGTNYTLGPTTTQTMTIYDDETLPNVQINYDDSVPITEGTNTHLTFKANRPFTANTTVYYSTSGTATSGSDYAALSGSVTFVGGFSTAMVNITTSGAYNNTVYEGTEQIIITLLNGDGYVIDPAMPGATVTIDDDDAKPIVSVTATDATATEAPGDTGTFTFTLNTASAIDTVVTFNLSGTASASDYLGFNQYVTIPAGQTSTTLTITPVEDTIYEGTETLTLTLTSISSSHYTLNTAQKTASITIADDDTIPTVTITALDASASESGDTATFLITLSNEVATDIDVYWDMSGTATDGTDFPSIGGSVTIPANATSKTVTISPQQDSVYEGDETFTLTLSADPAYTIGAPDNATITITDDDTPPVATIAATTATTTEGSGTGGKFTITLSAAPEHATVVNYTIGGTAINGTDYAAITTSATVSAGATTKQINVGVNQYDDSLYEGTETVILTLASGTGYSIGSSNTATVNINDNDSKPTVTVAATDNSASEAGPATGVYTVTLSAAAGLDEVIAFTMSGTASSGDYTLTDNNSQTLTTSLTIPAGSTTGTITLTPIDDATVESSETAIITLTSGSTYTLGSPKTATINISSDDVPVASISATDAGAAEPTTNTGTFTITLSQNAVTATTVNFTISGSAVNGTDYNTIAASASIASGASSATVTITPKDDSIFEGDETVTLTLASGTNYTVSGVNNAATVTISDNETAPIASIAATDASASETASDPGTFTITLSGTSAYATTVNYTIGGTTINGTDYTTIGTSVSIPAGSTSATVTFTPSDDSIYEGNQTVILTLVSGTNYTVSGTNNAATVTIADNEAVPTATISATDPTATETGGDTGTITVSLSGAAEADTVVNFTVGGSATNGTDYVAFGTSVTITAGNTSATITVTPNDDSVYEGSETVIVTLTNGSGYTVGGASSATVTISENETAPVATVTASDSAAAEAGSDTGTFLISLSGVAQAATVVNFTLSGGATSGADFTSIGTSVSIPGGQTSATLTITPNDDNIYEGNETVVITLGIGSGYSVGGQNSASITIADNESVPSASIIATDATAAETGGNTGTFTVSISPVSSVDTTVNYSVGGTAASAADYTALSGSVTITAGNTSAAITVTPQDDSVYEGSETVIVTLAAGTGYTVSATNSTTVTINDDESVPVATISATDAIASEPGSNTGTFTVSLNPVSSVAATVNFSVGGTATSGTDYTAIGTSILIPANTASATITLTPSDDAVYDGDETVIVTLASGTGYTIGTPSSATVTIQDDEPAPTATIAATDSAAAEAGLDTGTFTITLSSTAEHATVVNFSVGGTASSGDFNSLGTSLSIPAGQTTGTLTVTPVDDTKFENVETVVVTITSGTGYQIGGNSSATVNITSDDTNNAPVASNGSLQTAPGATSTGTLSASDIDGQALTYSIVAQPTKGTVNITNVTTGAFSYTAGNTTGSDTFTFKVNDGLVDSNIATVNITITANNAAPTAAFGAGTSKSGLTGHAVNLDGSSSSDSDGTIASYTWNFGDDSAGATTTSSSTTHAYTAAGIYTVTLNVTDNAGAVSAAATTSIAISFGGGAEPTSSDSDGDGFSDELEALLGSNASSAADTPFGPAPLKNIVSFTLVKASIGLDFGKPLSDAIAFSGKIPAPASTQIIDKTIAIDVGDNLFKFTLTKTGSAKSGNATVKFKLPKLKPGQTQADSQISFSAKKGDFQTKLADEGLLQSAATATAPVVINVLLDNAFYQAVPNFHFTVKKTKGKATAP